MLLYRIAPEALFTEAIIIKFVSTRCHPLQLGLKKKVDQKERKKKTHGRNKEKGRRRGKEQPAGYFRCNCLVDVTVKLEIYKVTRFYSLSGLSTYIIVGERFQIGIGTED